jgi:hypothetical protein
VGSPFISPGACLLGAPVRQQPEGQLLIVKISQAHVRALTRNSSQPHYTNWQPFWGSLVVAPHSSCHYHLGLEKAAGKPVFLSSLPTVVMRRSLGEN